MRYDVIVVGAGLGGASVAIHLAKTGLRVLLLEKQRLPAHKLCGEFLSTEVGAAFARLGVLEAVRAAGAREIGAAFVTTADGASFEAPLPGRGLGLSRYRLDMLLFEHARACGADARDGTPVRGVSGGLHGGFEVETDAGTFAAQVVIGAYGKRSRLDRRLGRAFLRQPAGRVGFKAHYEGLELPGVIELHAFPGGYCGLLPVEDGRVNACWIADAAVLAAAGDPEAMIRQALLRNPVLARRFGAMHRVSERFLAVGQVSFARKELFASDVCMVGDAAAMIAPLCGDGMAMALRSAEIAAPLAAAFASGRIGAYDFRKRYADEWESAFRTRLRAGRWLHRLYSRPALAALGVRACRYVPGLAGAVIRATRG